MLEPFPFPFFFLLTSWVLEGRGVLEMLEDAWGFFERERERERGQGRKKEDVKCEISVIMSFC